MTSTNWYILFITIGATAITGWSSVWLSNKLDAITKFSTTRSEAEHETRKMIQTWIRRITPCICLGVLIFELFVPAPVTRAALRNVIVSLVVLVSVYLLDLLRVLETLVRLHPPPRYDD